jgi:hypothetical protein
MITTLTVVCGCDDISLNMHVSCIRVANPLQIQLRRHLSDLKTAAKLSIHSANLALTWCRRAFADTIADQ